MTESNTASYLYEVINKVTGEVTRANLKESDTNNEGGAINDTVIVALENGTELTFKNPEAKGQLFNEEFAIRLIGSKGQADGTGFVTDEGVNVDTKAELEASEKAEVSESAAE